ncbi:hypothetical protein L7F22_031177 [Adiantum nelumboides]|nr:hypothetical protein [Adiantum nelumboides]
MLVAKSSSVKEMDARIAQEKKAHHNSTPNKGVYHKNLQATAALEVVRESNGDETASTGTSSSALSSTAVSSSSASLSSSSLSESSPVGSNRGGWKGMSLCRRPLWQQNTHHPVGMRHVQPAQVSYVYGHQYPPVDLPSVAAPDVEISTTSRILKALLVSRRRLRFEPSSKLYFPYEPGKQSTSAVRIRNVSRSNVAFKFQTTSPKSCFMRPPTGVLSPGECIVAIVVKFIELPKSLGRDAEVPLKRRTRDKFKIVSLKIHEDLEFTPELFEEHREHVAVEQILQVVLLDPKQPSTQLERLKVLMLEADCEQEAQSKSKILKPTDIHDVSVLEEWKQRKLARQQAK